MGTVEHYNPSHRPKIFFGVVRRKPRPDIRCLANVDVPTGRLVPTEQKIQAHLPGFWKLLESAQMRAGYFNNTDNAGCQFRNAQSLGIAIGQIQLDGKRTGHVESIDATWVVNQPLPQCYSGTSPDGNSYAWV